MTPKEFYKQLAITTEHITITLAPGPLKMRGSPQDALSAELMLWLIDRLGGDATQGDVEEVLTNALWWSRFWAAVHYADTHEMPEQQMGFDL